MSNNINAVFDAYELIDKLGNDWAKMNELIDFESFREVLEERWRREINPAKGGRPPWDAVLMFKILLIGKKTGLSDERLEYDLTDSLSLRRFIGLVLDEAVPDRYTIACFRSELDEDTVRVLFEMVDAILREAGFEVKSGKIIDSSFVFVLVPTQRNSQHENRDIARVSPRWGGLRIQRQRSWDRRTGMLDGPRNTTRTSSAIRTLSVRVLSTS